MFTIFKREFKAYFTSPIGASILMMFYFFSGLLFGVIFSSGVPELSEMFSTLFIIVMAIIPILTMRLFSEEKRQKTDQLLYTAPIRLSSVALGKFLAASAVYAIALAILVVYQIIIALFVSPDWMVFFGNFLGILLYGCSLIAIGMFVSSLTESQVVAAIITFAIELVLLLVELITQFISSDFLTKIVSEISVYERYNSFTRGTLDYSNIIFFISVIAIFVFLTIRIQDRKRYA